MTTPRVAAEDTTDRQIEAFERSMLAEGFKGVLGTCRGETACRTSFQRRQADLIETYKEDKGSYGDLFECLPEISFCITGRCHRIRLIYPAPRTESRKQPGQACQKPLMGNPDEAMHDGHSELR